MEGLDPLTPLGRRVLNDVRAREPGEPGWVVPGGERMLADPVELGWVAVSQTMEIPPNIILGEE
jgi:hypothetical protein